MNPFVIGVDLDATTLDFSNHFARFVEKRNGLALNSLPAPTDWNFTNWPGFDFLTDYRAFVEQGELANLVAFEGASQALWRMSDAGIHIRIITNRLIFKGLHAKSVSDTITSLERNNIPYRDICIISSKHEVGANVYLDDAPHVIKDLQNACRDIIIYSQEYNKDISGNHVRNWTEVETEVMMRFEKWSAHHPFGG